MAGKGKGFLERLAGKRPGPADLFFLLLLLLAGLSVSRNAYQYDREISRFVSVESPWLVRTDGAGKQYIVDQEKARILIVANGEAERIIHGAAPAGDTFYSAENIDIAGNGDIYVQETGWSPNGFSLDYESILRYSPKGECLGVCYETDYSELYTDKHRIFGMDVTGDSLYFVTADAEGFSLHRLALPDGEEERLFHWEMDQAYTMIQDFVIDPGNRQVYAVDKRGKLYLAKPEEAGLLLLYDAAENPDAAGEKSVLYRGALGADGTLYVTDIAAERLLAFSPETGYQARTVLEGSQMWSVSCSLEADGSERLSFVADGGVHTAGTDGLGQSDGFSYEKSTAYLVREALYDGAFVAFVLAIFALALRIAAILLTLSYSNTRKISILVTATVLAVSGIIVYGLMGQFHAIYRDELLTKLSMAAQIVENDIDATVLSDIERPENYMNESYQKLWNSMETVLDKSYEYSQDMYCNILRYDGETGYAVVYLDNSIGTFYPLTDVETEQVRQVYETGTAVGSDVKSETGSYIYVMLPILDAQGQVTGVVSVGTLSSVLEGKIDEMTGRIAIAMIMIVLVIMFLCGEALSFFELREKAGQKADGGKRGIPMHIVRLSVFVTFLAFNMATSFLPVYILRFVREDMAIPAALAGSLPMTLNLMAIGLTSIICPGLMKRMGFRNLAAASGFFALCGDLMMAFCFQYGMVVAGLVLNGIGVGLITNSIHIFIASIADEEQDGFSIFNAASLSGINCGMLFGSALAERMDQGNVYFVSAAVWLFVILIFFLIGGRFTLKDRKEEQGHGGMLRFIASPSILKFMLCVQVPYIIINSFTYYYVPIYGSEHDLSENMISLLIILCSLCSVYLSVTVTNYVTKRFQDKAMYLSTVITFAGLLLFAFRMSLPSLVGALLLIGLANSFGSATRISRFIRMDAAVRYGEDNAMGAYDLVDNLGESTGSIIFASIISVGFSTGILTLIGCVGGLNVLYALTEKGGRGAGRKE